MNYFFIGIYLFFTTIALIVYYFLGRGILDKIYAKRGEEKYMECRKEMDRNYKFIALVYVVSLLFALTWWEGFEYIFDKCLIPYTIVVLVVNILLPTVAITKVKDYSDSYDYSKLKKYYASSQYTDELQIFFSCMVAPFFGFAGFFFKFSTTYLP